MGNTRPQIPTIRGLLVLAGRQCAVGNPSEGWLYTGMAIRMLSDLGLHLDLHRLAELEHLTPADLELRKRLYCSACVWDKTLSLSLGRSCSMRQLSASALDLFDNGDNDKPWCPSRYPDYPSTPIYNTLCFQQFCRLGRLVDLIMISSSLGSGTQQVIQRVTSLESELNAWYKAFPKVLRTDDDGGRCPPPHIFSLNLLYHILHIILWRSYRHDRHGSPDLATRARTACVAKSKIVHDMFLLYGKQFNLMYMTYLISYCVYTAATAATVDVDEMKAAEKSSREAAAKRLGVSLRILETEAKQTPGVRRSIDVIKRQLRTWGPGTESNVEQHRPELALPVNSTVRRNAQSPITRRDATGAGGSVYGMANGVSRNPTQFGDRPPATAIQHIDYIPQQEADADDDALQALLGVTHMQNFSEPFYVDTGGGFLPDNSVWDFGDVPSFTAYEKGFSEIHNTIICAKISNHQKCHLHLSDRSSSQKW